jgi:hypothetical protein
VPWRVHIHACLFVLAPRSSSCSCNPVSDTDSVCIVWSNLINQHAPLFFVLVVPFFGKTTQHVYYTSSYAAAAAQGVERPERSRIGY